jgi:hypothetical protein
MEHKAGRTGFDIRADLIKLAFDFEFSKFNTEHGVGLDATVPTIEDILNTASKMNTFVSNK